MAAVSTITNNADLEKAGIHCGTSNNENHEHAELSTPEESDVAEDGAPLEKVKSVNSISSIPNGGLRAWLVVVGSFFLFFNSWFVLLILDTLLLLFLHMYRPASWLLY